MLMIITAAAAAAAAAGVLKILYQESAMWALL